MGDKTKNILWIFLHSPRTGGTTFISHLEKYFKRREDIFDLDFKEDTDRLSKLSEEEKDKIKFLVGHNTYYGLHELFPGRETRYLTFVRDPAKQIVSQYNYDIRKTPGIRISFEKWYKSQLRNQMVHVYDRIYKGKPFTRVIYPSFIKFLVEKLKIKDSSSLKLFFKTNISRKLATKISSFRKKSSGGEENELENAKKLLDRCWFIGITENLEEDLKSLIKEINLSQEKKMPVKWEKKRIPEKKFMLDEKTKAKIYRENLLDVELCEYAKNLKEEKNGK